MPDLETVPTEPEEPVRITCPDCSEECDEGDTLACQCPNCEGCRESCECDQCEACDRWNDDCECTTCQSCDNRFNEEGCTSCAVCQRCMDRGRVTHYTCEGCGGCLNEDSLTCAHCYYGECCARFSCSEESHCDGCCACHSCDLIQPYSSRDYPTANPPESTVPTDYLYLGVELECEAKNSEELAEVAEAINKEHADRILMKEDGSLSCGLELVTGKYGLDAQQKLWPGLLQVVRDQHLKSWNTSTCGMHVHLSRSFFTPLSLGKFLVFFNSDKPEIAGKILLFAGRTSEQYARKVEKRLCCRHLHSDRRYEAVNLTNNKTIEVRIFKGTTKTEHVLSKQGG